MGHSLIYAQQQPKLNQNLKLDTLRIWINYPTNFDKKTIGKYDSILDNTIRQFNTSASFTVKKDSANPYHRIIMNMGPIRYVDTKHNILSTGLSLALIGGHIYMISTYAWTLPIFPVLLPATTSKVELQIDPKMISSKPQTTMRIASNGYLRKKEKQSQKFEHKFHKKIYKFLKKIDKQNLKHTH